MNHRVFSFFSLRRAPRSRAFCAAATVLFFAGCSGSSNDSAPAGSSAAPVPVQAATVLREDVPEIIRSIGTVQSIRTVAVRSQVDGVIAKIDFKEGQEVAAGDLLVTLDRRPFENSLHIAQADLATSRANAVQAQADATRYQHLAEQSMVAQDTYTQLLTKAQTAKADVQSKEAALANAELQLGYTAIRAPIAGRTGQLQLHEGALIKANDPGSTIVVINQLTPISVAFSAPEDYFDRIRATQAQQPLAITVESRAEGVAPETGTLNFIDNSIDPATGTILLKAVFPNADHALWPGEFVNVDTQLSLQRNALVVPSTAVETGQDGSQVYVIKPDHTVELLPVKIARIFGNLTLIASGLDAGETVVTDGQLRLVPGVHVEITTLAQATAAGEAAAGAPRS